MSNDNMDAPVSGAAALTDADTTVAAAAPETTATPSGRVRQAADTLAAGGKVAGEKVTQAARATGQAAGKAAVLLADLNGDGKIDEEDAKIMAAKVRDVADETSKEVGGFLKDVIKHDVFRDVAAFALIGAVIAIPLPVVGPAVGAAVGAMGGLAKNILTPRKR